MSFLCHFYCSFIIPLAFSLSLSFHSTFIIFFVFHFSVSLFFALPLFLYISLSHSLIISLILSPSFYLFLSLSIPLFSFLFFQGAYVIIINYLLLRWVLKQHSLVTSMTHLFSFFSTPNKKGRGWIMDTGEFCLRTHLRGQN